MIVKREFRITNTQWPQFGCNYRDHGTRIKADEEGVMVCRWRMITQFRNAARRMADIPKPFSRTLYHMSAADVEDEKLRGIEDHKSAQWRGTKIRGGSYKAGHSRHGVINLENEDRQPLRIGEGQKYTFGDMFCGAGGASRGALSAGVHVSFACDLDEPSCESYRMNFPNTDLRQENVSDLVIGLKNHDMRLDILHISPPCQYYSPAHTVAGKNDDMNRAILLATREIIYKVRPRIATVEQTFGILREQHTHDFHLLLNCFTANGYSVTWKFVKLTQWGVPQPRKRVIMVASCPGEVHPEMPGPSDFQTSTNMFLAQIDPDATHHDLERLNMDNYPKAPWDGDAILRHTITTSASGECNYHPSGLRPFTVREFAMMQTFPCEHQFVQMQTQAKRQIGNAFPPLAVQYLYEKLLLHLRGVDKACLSKEVEMIEIDGEEEDDLDLVCIGSRDIPRR